LKKNRKINELGYMQTSAKLTNKARWTKEKREKTQVTKIRRESRDITIDCIEIKKVSREYYE
jgi:hypothetical protein